MMTLYFKKIDKVRSKLHIK